MKEHRSELVKAYTTEEGRTELRAVTGPDYGRIHDHELVEAVMRIAGDGTGDTRWKVPGVLDWGTMRHNPDVDVTAETTTLYASDRDVFLFLCDDLNPIEAGRLPSGEPDLYFRGFYCWNSEVGSRTLGIASFYLRAVCQNRNLWGTESFEEITIRHSATALITWRSTVGGSGKGLKSRLHLISVHREHFLAATPFRPRRDQQPVPPPPPSSARHTVSSRPDRGLPGLGRGHRRRRCGVTTGTPS